VRSALRHGENVWKTGFWAGARVTRRSTIGRAGSLVVAFCFVGVLTAGVFAGPSVGVSALTRSPIRSSGPSAASGAALGVTFVLNNTTEGSHTGYAILGSPCYRAGFEVDVCNATVWVTQFPNGTCSSGGGRYYEILGLSYPAKTSFYFVSGDPTVPYSPKSCGGGPTATVFHFWFQVLKDTGKISTTVTLYY
jgi:hypothetical protein